MHTALDILNAKSLKLTFSITPDATVYEAIKILAEKNIGALPVLENGKLVGMFSERDYTYKIALHDRASRTTLVNEIMSTNLITIPSNASLEQCLARMTDKHIRHLPVLNDQGDMLGMLSIGDLVKGMIAKQQQLIQQLQSYISGM